MPGGKPGISVQGMGKEKNTMQDRETQEIRLIHTGDRKPVSRRRKINWRAMYKRAMRRVWGIGIAAYLSVVLNVIQAIIIYMLQAI